MTGPDGSSMGSPQARAARPGEPGWSPAPPAEQAAEGERGHGGIGWKLLTGDGIVHRGPCLFYGVMLRAASGGVGRAIVYDGLNVSGRLYMHYSALASETEPLWEQWPVRFEHGIYVDVVTTVDGVLLRYKPLRS